MKVIIKNFKTNSLASAIIFIVLGLFLTFLPGTASAIVGYLLGAAILALGITTLITYFIHIDSFLWYQGDFLLGLSETLIGLIIVLNPGIVLASIPFFFGLILFIHGIIAIGPAIEQKQLFPESKRWIFSLCLAIISIVLGFIIFNSPYGAAGITLKIIGVCLIYSGVSDLITYFRARRDAKTVKRNPTDGSIDGYVDADFRDVK